MMKCYQPTSLASLIFFSAFLVEAHAAVELPLSAKPVIQAVVHADGSVVDRLKLPHSAKSAPGKYRNSQEMMPDSPEAWLSWMMDPTRHGLVVKHPELFAEWLDAITEPRFMTALASAALVPETYSNTLGKMVDPATVRNWAEFADPQIYLRWMAAGLDPNFYQAVFNRMTETGKLQRWGLYSNGVSNSKYEKPHKPLSLEPAKRSLSTSTSTSPSISASTPTSISASALAAQDWVQLPVRGNPWLTQNMNYRY
jgi:hypothetical protein